MITSSIFAYLHKGRDKNAPVPTEIYTFKCDLKITYIIEVEYHQHDIVILKFYQKNHRHSENRYSLLNSSKFLKRNHTNGASNFLKILNTITIIAIKIFQENRNLSIGFIGSPTNFEKSELNSQNINPDLTVAKTKRYNVYSIYVKRYFSPEQFDHVELETSSSYLLKSKNNKALTVGTIEEFFRDYINNYC